MSNTTSKLDKATNVAFIITCVILCVYVSGKMVPSNRVASGGPPRLSYKTGDKLPAVPGVKYAEADVTVVLFVQSECRYCKESMPFYKRLADTLNSRGGASRRLLIAASFEDEITTKDYLAGHGVRPDGISRIRPGTLAVQGTPTLFVVDRSGTLRGAWMGRLDASAEREVLKTVS